MTGLISLLFLALGMHLATTSEYSGLISSLYKKAADENRPLVLVLDNSLKGAKDSVSSVSSRAKSTDRNTNSNAQLLDLLSKKYQEKTASRPRNEVDFDHPITDHSHSDLHRLQDKLEEDIRERKERRLKKRAKKVRDENRNVNKDDAHRVTSSMLNRFDIKSIQNENQKQKQLEQTRALRSSVIKSLLRTYNDLNCDAKDECEEEESKNDCDEKFEKFDCDDKGRDDNCNDGNDTCEAEEDQNISTRGVLLETEKDTECKRC